MTLSLDILDQEELDKFEKFINSPFFNSRPKIIALFEYLKNNENVNKESAFSAVYINEKYNDARIRRLFSDFTAILEKFLGYLNMEIWEDDFVTVKSLGSLVDKGLNKRFDINYKDLSARLKKIFIKDDAYYRNLAEIELLNHYVNGSPGGLKNSVDNIDLHFIFAKLHRYRDILLFQSLHPKSIDYKMLFWDEIIEYIKANITAIKKEHPNLYIIYLTVMAMANKNGHTYISVLKEYLSQNERRFNKERLSYYYNYVVSFYWMQINEGKTGYYKDAYAIYRIMEKKGLFRTERYVPHNVINNVAMAAAANYDYEWLEKFINDYRKRIEPEFAEDVFNLSLARILFYKVDYSGALNFLNKITYRNSNYFFNSKMLLARIKYEQGDLNGIKYVVDSLRHYSKMKKTLVPQQVSNLNMAVKYLRLLVRAARKGSDEALKMKESLDNEKKSVPAKDWFYEKLSVI